MRSEFVSLLQEAEKHEHIGAIVVTYGYGLVWEKVLANTGLAWVKVIGGGRLNDGMVVTAAVKGALVAQMREYLRLYVRVFGDSPLDLEMLVEAD